MCNMSQSMRMRRLEYNLYTIKNTDNTDNGMKNDLGSTWTYSRPRGQMLPFIAADTAQNSMHCMLVACPWHLVPTIDLSAHMSQ